MEHGLYEPDAGLLMVAAVMLGGWYLLLGLLTLLRWPRTPPPGSPTQELREEPPAVANLLTNGWLLSEDSLPATLLDLATRGFVVIEDRGDGVIQCRLQTSAFDERSLQPYEKRILDHLRSRASGGVVPAGALTTGPQEQSSRWWKSFRKEVGTDAKERGVARELWPFRLSVLMFALGVPIFLVVQASHGFRDLDDVQMTPLLIGVTYTMYAALVPLSVLTGTARLRDTPAGQTAAAHWFGVRDSLETLPSFPELPPDAVVTWERHLAYGAALGVAGRTVHELPLGAEHDRRAWTHYGGKWKQVRVSYPRLRLGWGMHPLLAVLLGLARTVACVGILWAAASLGFLRPSAYGESAPWWVALVITAVVAVLLALICWFAIGVAWGLLDVAGGTEVEGEVLRTRVRKGLGEDSKVRYFVAVYPGTGDRIRAWRVNAKTYPYFYQGQIVTVIATPRLGFVRVPEEY